MTRSVEALDSGQAAMAATLSVIIPFVNSYSDIRNCLRRLRAQDVALEIIVIDRLGGEARAAMLRDYPEITLIEAAPDATIPQMRAMGHARASAELVAVIEDHVMVPADWAKRMIDAVNEGEGHQVVAGAFENTATDNKVDWAAFLCEYSSAIPPLPSGPVPGIPGNNTIYRKSLLGKYQNELDANRWENHMHDAMRADGVELIMRPDIVVGHKMHYTFKLYMQQRYLYSRAYAGNRGKDLPLSKRLVMGAASFALPPLLFKRTIDRIKSKGKHGKELRQSLPMLAAFVTSWGLGEVVGYWFGPGDALSKVR